MSALRTMIAALWAAVWVRWKLLAVRARRAFGGDDPAAAAGSGYYLSAAEIPVEGVDYDVAELSPELVARLDAARAELLDRAGAGPDAAPRPTRARRRRTVPVVVASLVGLALVAGGASALVAGTTGVPAVDRLLGIYEQNRPGSGVQPDSAAESASVELTTPDGQRIVSTSYVARDGRICTVIAGVEGGGRGGFTCSEPDVVAGALDRRGGVVSGVVGSGGRALLTGFVRADVAEVEVSGPDGKATTAVGREWSPETPGLGLLRPILAIADTRPDRSATRADYKIHAVTGTGERLQITP